MPTSMLVMMTFSVSLLARCCVLVMPSRVRLSLINNIPNRTTISLNGSWHYIVDPYETGLKARFYLNAKPKDKHELVEYDFDKSDVLNVPGDWNTQKKELFFYEGPIWYEKSFSYHKREHTRVFVNFGAANYFTRVYLNGEALGEHEGGFTPSTSKSPTRFTTATIFWSWRSTMPAGATLSHPSIPTGGTMEELPEMSCWWRSPKLSSRTMFVQLAKGSSQEIAGWVQLTARHRRSRSHWKSQKRESSKPSPPTRPAARSFTFPPNSICGRPDHPKLYDVVLSSGADKVHDSIGFRTIETRGTQILLNGKPIFLRGISMHEEAPNPRGPRLHSAGRRDPSGMGKGTGLQLRSPRPLSSQRKHDPPRRPHGPDGLV